MMFWIGGTCFKRAADKLWLLLLIACGAYFIKLTLVTGGNMRSHSVITIYSNTRFIKISVNKILQGLENAGKTNTLLFSRRHRSDFYIL